MLVNCFTHVIDSQKCHLHSCQSLHFHAGFPLCLDGTEYMNTVLFLIQFIIYRTFLYRKRMTHRNQFGCFFDPHNACHPCHTEDITFFDISFCNACHDLRAYRNIACCQCCPISDTFIGNIHHHCISFFIKMCKSVRHDFSLLKSLLIIFTTVLSCA